MTEVTNGGTAYQEPLVEDRDLTDAEVDALLRQRPGQVVWVPDEPAVGDVVDYLKMRLEPVPVRVPIKPLSHWRGVDAGAQPGEPGWQKLAEVYRRVMAEIQAKLIADHTARRIAVLEAKRAPDEAFLDEMAALYREKRGIPEDRKPFPARALRDRPWDISALVEGG